MLKIKEGNASYLINEEKSMVICIMEDPNTGLRFKGIAKKSPEDTFDAEIGKSVAFKKALIHKIKYDIRIKRESIRFYDGAIANAIDLNKKRIAACERMTSKINSLRDEIISL